MQLACFPKALVFAVSPDIHMRHDPYKTREGDADVSGSLLFLPSLARF